MDLMTMFVLLAALATAISLFNGITSMAHGGESDQECGQHRVHGPTLEYAGGGRQVS